jgi:ABC-type transport system substrate-binding protein
LAGGFLRPRTNVAGGVEKRFYFGPTKEETRMKSRLFAGPVMAAAVLAAGLSPAIASAQGMGGAPTIPLLVTGDTGSFFTLDASKDTEVGNIYGAMESLVTLSPTGRVEPSLAESVTTPNLTTYVIHLRQGVRFWDGDQMTSADVLNALDYYRRPGRSSPLTI